MTKRQTGMLVFKYALFVLLMLLVYVLQNTPAFLTFFEIKPLLVVPLAVCIAMFQGEFSGALFGALAGLLCDLGGMTVFGFNGLVMLVLCTICGLLILFWMRKTLISSLFLCLGALLVRGSLEYLICLAMWGYEGVGQYYLTQTLPGIGVSLLFSVPLYFLVRKISRKFEVQMKL